MHLRTESERYQASGAIMARRTRAEIATTIADQIGHRARVMLGARDLVACDVDGAPTLRMRIGRGPRGIGILSITLEPSDTYTVRGYTSRGREVACSGDVYAEGLRAVIAHMTGLAVSL